MGSAQFKSTESDGILVLEDVLECLLEIDPNLNFAHAGNLLHCRMGFSIPSALRSICAPQYQFHTSVPLSWAMKLSVWIGCCRMGAQQIWQTDQSYG